MVTYGTSGASSMRAPSSGAARSHPESQTDTAEFAHRANRVVTLGQSHRHQCPVTAGLRTPLARATGPRRLGRRGTDRARRSRPQPRPAALSRGARRAELGRPDAHGEGHAVGGELPAEDRSWIGLILQAGIKSFIDWFRHGEAAAPSRPRSSEPHRARSPATSASSRRSRWCGSPSWSSTRTSTRCSARPTRPWSARRPALRARGRVRDRRGLRPGRRAAGRLGRPARGAGRRLAAARRGRRDDPLPRERAGLGRPGHVRRDGRSRRSGTARASTRYAASPATAGSTASARSRATGSWSCSAASTDPDRPATPSRRPSPPGPVVIGPVVGP